MKRKPTKTPTSVPISARRTKKTAVNTPQGSSVLSKTVSLTVKVCAIATSVIAAISDILSPLAPFALYIGAVLFVVLAILLLLAAIPFLSRKLNTLLGVYWPGPIILVLVISTGMLIGSYSLGTNSGSGGYLADTVPLVADMQNDIGFIRDRLDSIAESTRSIDQKMDNVVDNTGSIAQSNEVIVENTGSIATTNQDIAQKSEVIADKSTVIAEQTELIANTVKKETSEDPQKELNNLGISWSLSSYINCLIEGNLRAISLFIDGGMTAATQYKGSSAILYAVQDGVGNDPIAIIKLFESKGFDLDSTLQDKRIMYNGSDGYLPFTYEAKVKPENYGLDDLYGMYFVGPLLFWVVMDNMWDTPTQRDLSIVRYLCEKGADKKYVFAFLDSPSIHDMYFEGKYAPTAHLPMMDVLGYAN